MSVSKCPVEHTFLYEFTFNDQIQSYLLHLLIIQPGLLRRGRGRGDKEERRNKGERETERWGGGRESVLQFNGW